MIQHLGVFVFSHAAAQVARELRVRLRDTQPAISQVIIHGPQNLLARHGNLGDVHPYTSLGSAVKTFWRPDGALLFIGATGIAVRAIAPFIDHKSRDAPVVVLDAACRFSISLLAGHWGGGNELAQTVAEAVGAQPVLTTASEALGARLTLDMVIKRAGAHILDWSEMATVQGRLLEGQEINIWDPAHVLPASEGLRRVRRHQLHASPNAPAIAIHWRIMPRQDGLLRIAPGILHVGVGFRKNLPSEVLVTGLQQALEGLEPRALRSLATVSVKAVAPALRAAAAQVDTSIDAFSPEELAAIPTPNPSPLAGEVFGTRPFSVCEAAALASAARVGRPCLLRPKLTVDHSMTFAVAIALRQNHA